MKSEIDWKSTNKIVAKGLYSGFAKILFNISHNNLSKFANINLKNGAKILEIGAGRGEHFKFLRKDFSEYLMTDLTNWGKSEISVISQSDNRVKFMLANVEKLEFPDKYFDLVIMSCVISHVDEPYQAMKELQRVTKSGGICSFFISADPGILLRIIRTMVTKPKMKSLKEPYNLVNAISHRNSANGLIIMAKWIFKNDSVKIKYYPFSIRSWNFSTHIVVNVIVK